MGLDKMVLFASPNDGIITPWQSAWFGAYAENSDIEVVSMEERDIYKLDLIGLKEMNEQGRILKIESGRNHLQYLTDSAYFKESILPWLLIEM